MHTTALGALGWQAGAGLLSCAIARMQLCNNAKVLQDYNLFTIAQVQFNSSLVQMQLCNNA